MLLIILILITTTSFSSPKNEYEYIKFKLKELNPSFEPKAEKVTNNIYLINKDYRDLILVMRLELEKRTFNHYERYFFQKKIYIKNETSLFKENYLHGIANYQI